MNKLKSPATWIGFLCAFLGLLMLPGSPLPATWLPWIGIAAATVGLFGSWFFDTPATHAANSAPDQKGFIRFGLLMPFISASFFLLMLTVSVSTQTACHGGNFPCGAGKVLVPPEFNACAQAFLAAAESVAGDIAACRIEPTSAACISGVIGTGKELLPCMPTCQNAPAPASSKRGSVGGSPHRIAPNLVKANVIESLRATGYPDAGK